MNADGLSRQAWPQDEDVHLQKEGVDVRVSLIVTGAQPELPERKRH